MSTAVKAILDWMHHILRSVKQHKAKEYAFSRLDENTGLWLSDWAQKVILVLFREGQREYFGKRGMSLHIDVLFRKVDNILLKNVYHTAISKCDQDTRDTLCISSHVIKQMKSDFPELKCLFRKSDNAGCYSANSVAELTHKICKENEIQLLRYDYNEPQRGKDQADRESSIAKRYLNAFTHSGHNCTTASELKQGILYLGGPESSKVSVVEISKNDTKITESKIQNIQSFHSVEFQEDKMTFWQYFGCGQGREIKYSNLTFESGLNVIKTFEGGSKTPKRHKKQNTRKDRCLNTLLFCPHPDCLQSFEQQDDFDRHIINGQHANVSLLTSMDSVKLTILTWCANHHIRKQSINVPLKK